MSTSVPEDPSYSSIVGLTSTLSSITSGVFVHENRNQISTSEDTSEDVYNSTYVHDEVANESFEISRDIVNMEQDGSSASMSMGVLHTDISSGAKTIQPVIQTCPTSTTINSCSSSTTCNLTLDGSISWNTDDASLYFSSDKMFRIRYIETDGSTPSRLVIEGYNLTTSEYVTKIEFHTD